MVLPATLSLLHVVHSKPLLYTDVQFCNVLSFNVSINSVHSVATERALYDIDLWLHNKIAMNVTRLSLREALTVQGPAGQPKLNMSHVRISTHCMGFHANILTVAHNHLQLKTATAREY